MTLDDCKHRWVQAWHFNDNGTPAGLWSCVDCGQKFVPLDLTQEKMNGFDAMSDKDVQEPKFLVFVDALEQLCKSHGVTLSTSGYDGLQVWDADDKNGPIHCAGIEDCMKPNA